MICEKCKQDDYYLTAKWKKNKFIYLCQACFNDKPKPNTPHLRGETTSKN